MIPITISEIVLATNGKLVYGNTQSTINSVFTDSRKIEKGGLFVPIIGEKIDAHTFISQVFEDGAAATLCAKDEILSEIKNSGAIIQVNDTVEALQNLAKYYRKKFNVCVIGVTGSVGKTTTKEMISAALSKNLKVLRTEGNQNGQIGLPLSVFNLSNEFDAAVFEMGISEIGEMEKLCEIVNPDFAVITNIGVSHIENFKKIETTRNEKMKILKKPEGIYFLNGDNPYLSNLGKNPLQKCIYFGLNKNYPFRAENIHQEGNETYFDLVTKTIREEIKIPCFGIHNVYNTLAAIAIALQFQLNLEDIKSGLLSYKSVGNRQQILDLNGITLINDSYNASPDSVKAGIDVLKSIHFIGRNIAVLADILELGEKSEEIHFELGKHIGHENIDILITIGEKSKFLNDGAKSVNSNINIFHYENNNQASEKLKEIMQKDDKILVKGSRGMKTEEIVERLTQEK